MNDNHPVHQGSSIPATSAFIAWAQFVELTGSHETRVTELIELGWLQPVVTTGESPMFRQADVYKTRKLERLCQDFEFSSLAGTIIVDLLERIADLEYRLRRTDG